MYENSPIKASLTASMMVLVESLSEAVNVKGNTAAKKIASVNKQLKPYVATVEAYEKQLSALRKNGFASAEIEKPQNVKLAEERISHAQGLIHNLRTLEAIEHLKFFGEHALLVRYDDFEKVMLAYDLRCTTLDRFTGQIPADKLNGLISVFDKMESLDEYWGKTINRLDYAFWLSWYFPFEKSRKGTIRLFIAAPKAQITQENRDPFVCAHTDYGILVLEKWGEEADHGIIKEYEKTPLASLENILGELNNKYSEKRAMIEAMRRAEEKARELAEKRLAERLLAERTRMYMKEERKLAQVKHHKSDELDSDGKTEKHSTDDNKAEHIFICILGGVLITLLLAAPIFL